MILSAENKVDQQGPRPSKTNGTHCSFPRASLLPLLIPTPLKETVMKAFKLAKTRSSQAWSGSCRKLNIRTVFYSEARIEPIGHLRGLSNVLHSKSFQGVYLRAVHEMNQRHLVLSLNPLHSKR